MFSLTYYSQQKEYKTKKQNAVLRAARCVASNLPDQALKIMKEYNISIRSNLYDDYQVIIDTPKSPYLFYSFLHVAFIYSSFKTIKRLLKEFGHWNFDHSLEDVVDLLEGKEQESLKNILFYTTINTLYSLPHLKCLLLHVDMGEIKHFCESKHTYMLNKTHRKKSYIYSVSRVTLKSKEIFSRSRVRI
jgi:hypothetical protein